MASRKDWVFLDNIGGRSTPSGKNGTGIRGAAAAGVTKDYTPKHIQELADSIKPDDQPATPAPFKSPLTKKYNIKGDTITMTPETFRGIFTTSSSTISSLTKLGVKTINIISDNVDMSFQIYDVAKNDAEWKDAPRIGTRDLMTKGIVQAAGLNEKITLVNNVRILGFLRVNSTDSTLAKMNADRANSAFHTTEWGSANQMSAKAVFKDSATVDAAACHYRLRGGTNLTYHFNDPSNLMIVGRLLHPELMQKHEIDFEKLRKIQIQHVANFISTTKAETQEQLISDVFKNAANGYALYVTANYSVPPIAVFIPHGKDLK